MLLDSLAPVWLECTLGHEKVPLLTGSKFLRANQEYKRRNAVAPSRMRRARWRSLLRCSCGDGRPGLSGRAKLDTLVGQARKLQQTLRFSFCTVRAAVISSLLDSDTGSSSEWCSRKENPAEDFHTTKKFVLLCRTVPAFKVSVILVTVFRESGRFPQQTRDSINRSETEF
jgi:hypothetical protein